MKKYNIIGLIAAGILCCNICYAKKVGVINALYVVLDTLERESLFFKSSVLIIPPHSIQATSCESGGHASYRRVSDSVWSYVKATHEQASQSITGANGHIWYVISL